MQLTKSQIAIIGGITLLLIGGFLFFKYARRSQNAGGATGQLVVWGVYDSEKTITDTLIAPFVTANPNVKVTYKQVDPDTYEQDLVNAMAAGNGPDIFMVKNTWLKKHADKMSPMPDSLLTIPALRLVFPDVIERDFTLDNKIYALPLYIDTLALLYNKTIFDNAGVALPPTSWEDFVPLVPKLRIVDRTGQIVRAAAAIGGSSNNINEATDLVNLLMMQDGAQFVTTGSTRASFADTGKNALQFYTDFANPRSNWFTWDSSQHYSLDAFAEENAAIIFNYAHQMPLLKQKNPFLNFAAAPMLQRKGALKQVNFANYFGFAVSNMSAQKDLAWTFVMNSTLDQTTNINYLNATSRPPAMRDVINLTLNDPELGVFSRQSLTASSWAKPDDAGVDAIFTKMINLIIQGQMPLSTAIKQAEEETTTLIQRRR